MPDKRIGCIIEVKSYLRPLFYIYLIPTLQVGKYNGLTLLLDAETFDYWYQVQTWAWGTYQDYIKLKSIINKCTRQEIFVQFKCLSLRPYAIWVIKCTTFSQLSIFCMWNVETQTQQTHTNIYYLSTHTKNVMIKYEMLSCLKLSFLLFTKKLLINHSNRKYNIANICFIWLYICFVYC